MEAALIISLIVLFIHATTWDGQINEWIKKIIDPESMIAKPIYGCPICMTFWYGSGLYFWIFESYSLLQWLLVVFAAAGFSTLWAILLMIKDALKKEDKK